jgi:hypothetical protein
MRKILAAAVLASFAIPCVAQLAPPPTLTVPQYTPPPISRPAPPPNPWTAVTAPIPQPPGARPIVQQSCVYVAQTRRMLCRNL